MQKLNTSTTVWNCFCIHLVSHWVVKTAPCYFCQNRFEHITRFIWLVLFSVWDRRKYAPKIGYFPSVSEIYTSISLFSVWDGNKWPKNAIFRLAHMVPPMECDLGYRFPTRTLNPKAWFPLLRNQRTQRMQRSWCKRTQRNERKQRTPRTHHKKKQRTHRTLDALPPLSFVFWKHVC